jgi:hypothetical protein
MGEQELVVVLIDDVARIYSLSPTEFGQAVCRMSSVFRFSYRYG